MSIPDAAVEAAMDSLDETMYQVASWEGVKSALEAAAPHMLAGALEDAAGVIDHWIKAGADDPVHPYETSTWLRNRAAQVRAGNE